MSRVRWVSLSKLFYMPKGSAGEGDEAVSDEQYKTLLLSISFLANGLMIIMEKLQNGTPITESDRLSLGMLREKLAEVVKP